MIKRMVIMLIAVGIVLGGFFAFQNFKAHIIQQVMATMANPPQTVATVTAGLQDWQPQVEAVGSLRAVNGADLSREVAGNVGQSEFDSGEDLAIVDLRHSIDFEADPETIPGAFRVDAKELEEKNGLLARDREIILYCT